MMVIKYCIFLNFFNVLVFTCFCDAKWSNAKFLLYVAPNEERTLYTVVIINQTRQTYHYPTLRDASLTCYLTRWSRQRDRFNKWTEAFPPNTNIKQGLLRYKQRRTLNKVGRLILRHVNPYSVIRCKTLYVSVNENRTHYSLLPVYGDIPWSRYITMDMLCEERSNG